MELICAKFSISSLAEYIGGADGNKFRGSCKMGVGRTVSTIGCGSEGSLVWWFNCPMEAVFRLIT